MHPIEESAAPEKITPSATTDPRLWQNRFGDWRVYAAAGVATLAAASAADADIIYSGTLNLQKGFGGTFKIGGQQVKIGGYRNDSGYSTRGVVNISFRNANAFLNPSNGAANFQPGSAIGGNNSGRSGALRRATIYAGNKNIYGDFATGQSGFVGFRFTIGVNGGGAGWLRLKVEADTQGIPNGVQVIDWAYNDAGGGITAGQGIGSAVPEPSSKALALLALGAGGVLAWRKRRSQVTAAPVQS